MQTPLDRPTFYRGGDNSRSNYGENNIKSFTNLFSRRISHYEPPFTGGNRENEVRRMDLNEGRLRGQVQEQIQSARDAATTLYTLGNEPERHQGSNFENRRYTRDTITQSPEIIQERDRQIDEGRNGQIEDNIPRQAVQQFVVTSKLPEFCKFEVDYWRQFKEKYLQYSLNDGKKSISELTSISCKQESTMFYDDDMWNEGNENILEILDKHFRIATKHDVSAKLRNIGMSRSIWKPDITALDRYCNKFTKILAELGSNNLPEVQVLCYIFTDGIQPKVLKDYLKSIKPESVRDTATKARNKCLEFISADAITGCYNRNFQQYKFQSSGHKYNEYKDHSNNSNRSKSNNNNYRFSRSNSRDGDNSSGRTSQDSRSSYNDNSRSASRDRSNSSVSSLRSSNSNYSGYDSRDKYKKNNYNNSNSSGKTFDKNRYSKKQNDHRGQSRSSERFSSRHRYQSGDRDRSRDRKDSEKRTANGVTKVNDHSNHKEDANKCNGNREINGKRISKLSFTCDMINTDANVIDNDDVQLEKSSLDLVGRNSHRKLDDESIRGIHHSSLNLKAKSTNSLKSKHDDLGLEDHHSRLKVEARLESIKSKRGGPIQGVHHSSLDVDYSKWNRKLDRNVDRKLVRKSANINSLKYNICQIDKHSSSSLPFYLVKVIFNLDNRDEKLVPIMARLDSLADVNWISKKLFLDLKSKYKINIIPCNILCKLVDKSEIELKQCCNLELSIQLKDNSKIKISCRFIIIDSDQDLVLGWNAIARFNLMQVNIANDSKIKNRLQSRNKNVQFAVEINYINSDLDLIELSDIANESKLKIDKQSCLKNSKISIKQKLNVKTFNKLVKFNTHVNSLSYYITKGVKDSFKILNDKWSVYYGKYSMNLANSLLLDVNKNATFCKLDDLNSLDVDNDSSRLGELAADGCSPQMCTDVEIDRLLHDKIVDIPEDKLNNYNTLSDRITEKYSNVIIDNPLGNDILADDDMIRSERSMFNFEIGSINNDLDTIMNKISDKLSIDQHRQIRDVLTKRVTAFSDVLPEQPARVPPFKIELKPDHKLKNTKTRKISSQSLASFCIDEINKLFKFKVICKSSSPVGSPIVLAKKPSVEPNKKNYRMCADYKDVNLNTIHRGCSIPNIRSSLNMLRGKKYFAKLDLTMGYHQCEVDKDCRWILAINTICGKYEWIRVPFGPQQAPGYFQDIMGNYVFVNFDDKNIVYFDDIVVF